MESSPARPEQLAAGIDEAGRGCLAGPVVACAAILNCPVEGLADSKKLTASQREMLEPVIKARAISWSCGVIWPRLIDRINILQATFMAMARAAATLRTRPGILLIDGNHVIPEHVLERIWGDGLPDQKAFIKGDANLAAISAASILAKTFRDRLMRHLARRWPGYGFEKHKGYPVPEHYEALKRLGPCPVHRLTFRGVAPQKLLHE